MAIIIVGVKLAVSGNSPEVVEVGVAVTADVGVGLAATVDVGVGVKVAVGVDVGVGVVWA